MAIFIIALTPPLGSYMAAVFEGKHTFMHYLLQPLETVSYKMAGIDANTSMRWTQYTQAWITFNIVGFVVLFLIQIFQYYLPLNPQSFSGVSWPTAFNTAISFVTNTNWQSYSGETTMSYFSQMIGLTVQNFVSASAGIGPFLVLVRGLTSKNIDTVGNFWVDLVRSTVYILLPLSIIFALLLVSQGTLQNFSPYVKASTLEGGEQTLPMGPVASQVAIKQLGTNGGGFFGANSAHPFENPTPFTNWLEMLAITLIPAALVYTYGVMIHNIRHGWLLFWVMFLIWGAGLVVAQVAEYSSNPALDVFPNYEGIETRIGITNSTLWSVSTTATANGSVNAMLSSLSPLTGGIALFNIKLGEIVFGGIGVGMCSMILILILTVFLSGLLVGRTPEYLGKKIEKKEVQWMVLGVMYPSALILLGAGISCILPIALASLGNHGPHGLSEIVYAFTSATGNNGSAFAGLDASTPYYNITLGLVMLLGRLLIVLPSFAIGGLLAKKKITPPSAGTFSSSSFLFFCLLLSVILIVCALSFFVPLVLGPFVEHMLMLNKQLF
jgi:K+-transporting ATPase ATPase A chain